jgi:hypothetical protein
VAALALVASLALVATACGAAHAAAKHLARPSPVHSQVRRTSLPGANPAVVGIALSGDGTNLLPPSRPSYKPYQRGCHSLADPGFGLMKCVVASAPDGTVAGVVEERTSERGPKLERDLVWRRKGQQWELALAHTFQNAGLATKLFADDLERDGDTKLVFITATDTPGFGRDLDIVEGTGEVVLWRYLGQGFVVVPSSGGLVTYMAGSTLGPSPAPPNAYDQLLIGYSGGAWRVLSQQYVPTRAALAQHRGVFSDPDHRAVPAS